MINRHAVLTLIAAFQLLSASEAYASESCNLGVSFRAGSLQVASVLPSSPAESAGIVQGDVIVAVDGRYVVNLEQFDNTLRPHACGDRVKITLTKPAKLVIPPPTVEVVLARLPDAQAKADEKLSATDNGTDGVALSESRELPAFQFKGVTAGQPVDLSKFKGCAPTMTDGVKSCDPSDETVAGIPESAMPVLGMYFYDDKLWKVAYTASNSYFETLYSALLSKYGSPCRRDTTTWQNRAGDLFPNLIVEWCFASGNLIINLRNQQRDILLAVYEDTVNVPRKTPPPAPPIDF